MWLENRNNKHKQGLSIEIELRLKRFNTNMIKMNSLKLNSSWRQQLTDALYFWSLLQIMVIPLGILVCRCLSLTHLVTFRFMMIYPSVTLFCVCLLPHFSTHIVKVTYWIFNSTVFQYLFYFLLWVEKKKLLLF